MDKPIQAHTPSSQRSQLRPQRRPSNADVPKEIVVSSSALALTLAKFVPSKSLVAQITEELLNASNMESTHDLNSSLSQVSFRSRVSSFDSQAGGVLPRISETEYIGESASCNLEAPAVELPPGFVGDLDDQLEQEILLKIHDEQSGEVAERLQIVLQTATLETKTLVLRVLRGQAPDFRNPLLVPELDNLLFLLIYPDFEGNSTSTIDGNSTSTGSKL